MDDREPIAYFRVTVPVEPEYTAIMDFGDGPEYAWAVYNAWSIPGFIRWAHGFKLTFFIEWTGLGDRTQS